MANKMSKVSSLQVRAEKRRLSQARRVAKSQNRMYVKVKCFISRLLHIKDVQHFFGTVNKTDTRSEYDIYYIYLPVNAHKWKVLFFVSFNWLLNSI